MTNPFANDKMLHHLDRLAVWQAGGLPAPVTVEFNVTNACNHFCPNCSFSYLVNKSKDQLPFGLASNVISQLAAFGVKAVTFSGGGEPLVYGQDRVLSLISQARAGGMDAALITNGSLLTDDRFLDLCEWVRISLDGYDAETFARYHGRNGNEFTKVCTRLRIFCAAAFEKKRRCEKCATVGAGYLTDRGDNGECFWKMAQFCAREFPGLDYLQFRPLVENMVADATLTGGWEGFAKCELEALQLAFDSAAPIWSRPDFRVLWSGGKYESLAQPNFGRTYCRCHGHFLEAVVAADARVYLCCHTQGQERFCLGGLRENTFAEIWRSDRARQVYESFDPRTTCPPACRLSQQNAMLETLLQPATHQNFI